MSTKNLGSLPVYRKSLGLYQLSTHIASFITYNKDLRKLYRSPSLRDNMAGAILHDARLISQQIARAESSNNYMVRVKSATFINIMIRNISSYCNGLERDGVKEKEYLNLLRKELRSFRKSFKKWRKSFGYQSPGDSWHFNNYRQE